MPKAPASPAPPNRTATAPLVSHGASESVRPLLSFRPTRSQVPLVNSLQPTMASMKPSRGADGTAVPGSDADRHGVLGGPRARRRYVLASAALLSVGAASLLVSRAHLRGGETQTRGAATAVLKDVGGGQHVRWRQDAIDVVVDKTVSDLAGAGLVNRSIDAWRASGAELPSISTKMGEDRRVGFDPKGRNENVIVYARDGWAKANGALAVTILTYDDSTGRILDADVLLNGGERAFAVLEATAADVKGGSPGSASEGVSQQGLNGASGKKSRFDVQSVLTHELGHFFGLGEDFDDTRATMYAKTSAGETHKRVLTTADSQIITVLYTNEDASELAGASKAGCGGAHVARGRAVVPTATWLGWGAAALGLGLLASRRQRPEPRRVRVHEYPPAAPRRRSHVHRCGGFMLLLGLGAAALPTELRAAEPAAPQADADVEIIATAPRWVDGIVETEVTMRFTACHVSRCPEGEQRVTVAGGSLDHVTQVVGAHAVPKVGTRASVALRDGSGLMKRLGPTYRASHER